MKHCHGIDPIQVFPRMGFFIFLHFCSSLLWGLEHQQNTQEYIVLLKPISTPIIYKSTARQSRSEKYTLLKDQMIYIREQQLTPFIQRMKQQLKSRSGQSISITAELPLISGVTAKLSEADRQFLKQFSEVEKIIPNSPLYWEKEQLVEHHIEKNQRYLNQTALNESLILHGIDRLIQEGIDIHRPGKIVGVVDTGVDASHPDLAGKVTHFYRPSDQSTTPQDLDTHGTHVSGIIAGGDLSGIQVGAYPGAKLVVTAALEGTVAMLKGWSWILDPDQNSQTQDQPYVINNSWHIGNADPTPFYRALEVFKQADILVCFSAGNSGTNGITRPKEHPLAFSSGAVDATGLIGSFSSWGPGKFQGQDTQKPEVSSMGVKVYSTLPNNKYGRLSGTSMASPLTTAAVALLGAYFPALSPYEVAKAIQSTLKPHPNVVPVSDHRILRPLALGASVPWDRQYGFGIVDVYAAYHYLVTNFPGQIVR